MSSSPRRPNILLITSDQHHWHAMGYNNPEVLTPNLDRLAAQGTIFDRAYCPNPTCTPTRASLITGTYPSQHGAYSLGTKLPESVHTVGELHIRHWLTPSSQHEGGHIGYSIAPSMRRKGLGTLQMALGMEKAREILETDRVLVTCDTDNVGSARVIENNGGVFEDHAVSERSGKQINRYWITLSPSRKPYGSSETLGVC